MKFDWMCLIWSIILINNNVGVNSIDCFKCTSMNGNNPQCDDPFNNNASNLLQTRCMAGRKHRDGIFPATACIKINGIFDETKQSMVIRDCALDSGSLVDTELVRMNHCGGFFFESKYVKGCVQSCWEDGCNKANKVINHHVELLIILVLKLFN